MYAISFSSGCPPCAEMIDTLKILLKKSMLSRPVLDFEGLTGLILSKHSCAKILSETGKANSGRFAGLTKLVAG
jgi:hypothetical protein